jgi:hypothetical protein
MIIEIKDLPKDRNVKKVTFDIEFEDGTVKSVKPTMVSTDAVSNENPGGVELPDFDDIDMYPKIENREKKDIPPEMTDLEF